ncbi:NuA4-domain-containing protein [Fistulina hepatica ATCC 64428]|uniref:Chromatin modification-related protein EAF6 n=1 Tax=Fistulina hepatica ATCC 64428 TaxID=1128425 RepID=A0A0D7AFB4_9AGAR|nr:NuA4-domain-containing protein [Fistulina hepatica ATCC 64428]
MTEITTLAASAEDRARYEALRRELQLAIPKKRQIDRQLAQIETQIHQLETTYLNETSTHTGGNIIHGFDGYLKTTVGGAGGGVGRSRRYEISDADRLFSNSSTTYQKSLDLMSEAEDPTYPPIKPPNLIVAPSAANNTSHGKKGKEKDNNNNKRKRASTFSDADEAEVLNMPATTSSGRKTKKARLVDEE